MLIDITRLVRRALRGSLATGIDRVSNAYLDRYSGRATALVRMGRLWTVLGRCESRRVFDHLREPRPGLLRRLASSIGLGIVWPATPSRHRLLIHTGHSGLEHPSYAREVRRRALLPLYFAHDLIPISHPQYSRAGEEHRHVRRLKTMFDTAEGLIVNSQATRAALGNYARDRRLRLPECVVAPLAPARMPAPSSQPPLAQNYFVILGTIEPRKNHTLLLRVWRRLVEKLGDAAPALVVIGQRGWVCEKTLEELGRLSLSCGKVLYRPRCGDRELSSWLQHARALLFPSFTEGFGLPLVEALAVGIPVLASDLPVFREIAGTVPEYLDPLDVSGWERAIEEYSAAGSARRILQLERINHYAPPTWDDHFEVVDQLIDRLQGRTLPMTANGGWAYVPGR